MRINPELIDWGGLSPEGKWAVREVLVRQLAGEKVVEIAARHGVSRYVLYRRLDRLAREIAGEVQPKRRSCAYCGERLPGGSRSHRLYCSGHCKVAAHREAKRAEHREAAKAATRRRASSRR